MTLPTTRVVIVGGGFGGLHAARALRRAPVEVTVVDRRNFHLFQPLLYQVATGGLSPGDIASPLRYVLRKQRNTRVLLGEVIDIDVEQRRLVLRDGLVEYDILVLAAGASHHYFGHPEWEPCAPGLKTIEDATEVRRRVLLAFETAEREPDRARHDAWLRFIVVGAGPTGVELAGALSEIANDTLRHDFRSIRPSDAEIILIEGTDRVLPTYDPALSMKAQRVLEALGVTVRLRTMVSGVEQHGVRLRSGDHEEWLPARTILWAAGVQASPLAAMIARATGAPLDRAGRVQVGPDLTIPGHPEIFAIGDMAKAEQDGKPLPGVAPVAMAQGDYVGKVIRARASEKPPPPPFRYRDKGSMATIGRSQAVADIAGLRFGGLFAWLTWLFVHLMYLVGFENRVLVLFQWAYSYLTKNRGTRLITGEDVFPLPLSESDSAAEQLAPEQQPAAGAGSR